MTSAGTGDGTRTGGTFDRLQGRLTRRAALAGVGGAGLGALAGRAGRLRVAAQDDPAVRDTLTAAITAEAFAVTFLGVALERAERLGFRRDLNRLLRAAHCEEEAHYHFFEAAGATPTTTTFSIANATFANRTRFLEALREVEAIAVGLYMAAARAFAAAGDLRLVEIAYQIGAVEAQHLAMVRVFLDDGLPADRAFAQWRFAAPPAALAALTDLGYLDGPGKEYAFPGPTERVCRGVFGLVPETADDQIPIVPAATPVT